MLNKIHELMMMMMIIEEMRDDSKKDCSPRQHSTDEMRFVSMKFR